MVHVLLKPGLENFEHYFTSVWDECNCAVVWAFFVIDFLWDWNENFFFQSCGHCCIFQVCWYIECSTFTASSFRIWNSSTGIPSPPLPLFEVILTKPYLTSHSRISGSKWVSTPLWLSGSWRSFLYSSVYSCHRFLIYLLLLGPYHTEPIFAWSIPLVSVIFLKRSLVFASLLFSLFLCIDHWGRVSYLSLLFFGTLHSHGYIFPFLLCFSLPFFSQLFVRPPQTAVLVFCISFSWGWSWLSVLYSVMNVHL